MRLGPFEIQYVGWKRWGLTRADKAALKAARLHAYESGEWNLIQAIKAYRIATMRHEQQGLIAVQVFTVGLKQAKDHCEELLRRYAP